MATPIQSMRGNHETERQIRVPGVGYVKSNEIKAMLFGLRIAGVPVPMNIKAAARLTQAQREQILQQIEGSLG